MGGRSGQYRLFRKKFIKQMLVENGKLNCHYCNINLITGIHPQPDNGATIDHVKPLSKGGKMYSKDNIVLCCYKCNCLKGDDIWKTKMN